MFCPWPQFTYYLIAVYAFFPDRLAGVVDAPDPIVNFSNKPIG
jgi:hypothetical protein